jgi:hypothetical protein
MIATRETNDHRTKYMIQQIPTHGTYRTTDQASEGRWDR